MARIIKRPKSDKPRSDNPSAKVSEPQAVYTRKVTRQGVVKRTGRKTYDAKRSSGMIPGIAERMKEYLKTMRDGR